MTASAPRTRRRGAELEQAILAAVIEELLEKGYAGATYDSIAARAGTSKPVLYRRWESKAQMVFAAIRTRATEIGRDDPDGLDTGGLGGDVEVVLRRMRGLFGRIGRGVALGLVSELDARTAADLPVILGGVTADLLRPLEQRARARGELGPRDVPAALLTVPVDLARHHLLLHGDLPDEVVARLAHEVAVPVWSAAAAG